MAKYTWHADVEVPIDKPVYTHDCKNCKFVGHFAKHDVYVCKNDGLSTILARYGNEGREYASCPVDIMKERFKKRSLIGNSDGGIEGVFPEYMCKGAIDWNQAMLLGLAAIALQGM